MVSFQIVSFEHMFMELQKCCDMLFNNESCRTIERCVQLWSAGFYFTHLRYSVITHTNGSLVVEYGFSIKTEERTSRCSTKGKLARMVSLP